MASVTVTLTNTCSGGGHLTLVTSGAKVMTIIMEMSTMSDPVSDEDALAFVRVLGKLGKVGRTNAQLKTLFQSGVTVSV